MKSLWRHEDGSPDVCAFRLGYIKAAIDGLASHKTSARAMRAELAELNEWCKRSDEELARELEADFERRRTGGR